MKLANNLKTIAQIDRDLTTLEMLKTQALRKRRIAMEGLNTARFMEFLARCNDWSTWEEEVRKLLDRKDHLRGLEDLGVTPYDEKSVQDYMRSKRVSACLRQILPTTIAKIPVMLKPTAVVLLSIIGIGLATRLFNRPQFPATMMQLAWQFILTIWVVALLIIVALSTLTQFMVFSEWWTRMAAGDIVWGREELRRYQEDALPADIRVLGANVEHVLGGNVYVRYLRRRSEQHSVAKSCLLVWMIGEEEYTLACWN